jgi:modification methylase
MDGSPCNGWEHWYLQDNGDMVPLDDFRKRYRIEQITPDG